MHSYRSGYTIKQHSRIFFKLVESDLVSASKYLSKCSIGNSNIIKMHLMCRKNVYYFLYLRVEEERNYEAFYLTLSFHTELEKIKVITLIIVHH
jgi:hypothetical protein